MVLEHSYYKSSADDRYQKHIPSSVVGSDMLPIVGCRASSLGTMVSTVSLTIHLASMVSDVAHSVIRRRSHHLLYFGAPVGYDGLLSDEDMWTSRRMEAALAVCKDAGMHGRVADRLRRIAAVPTSVIAS